MADVIVSIVNNSDQSLTLRFPEGSEMPAYLKSLERRELLKKVTIKGDAKAAKAEAAKAEAAKAEAEPKS